MHTCRPGIQPTTLPNAIHWCLWSTPVSRNYEASPHDLSMQSCTYEVLFHDVFMRCFSWEEPLCKAFKTRCNYKVSFQAILDMLGFGSFCHVFVTPWGNFATRQWQGGDEKHIFVGHSTMMKHHFTICLGSWNIALRQEHTTVCSWQAGPHKCVFVVYDTLNFRSVILLCFQHIGIVRWHLAMECHFRMCLWRVEVLTSRFTVRLYTRRWEVSSWWHVGIVKSRSMIKWYCCHIWIQKCQWTMCLDTLTTWHVSLKCG